MHQPIRETVRIPRRTKLWVKALLIVLGFALYLISTIPVGMTLYAIKSEMGWDFFRGGGYHALAACLREAVRQDPAGSPH